MTAADLTRRVLELTGEDAANPVYYTAEVARQAINEAQRIFALLTLCYETTVEMPLSKATPWVSVRPAHPTVMVPLWVGFDGVKLRPRTLREFDALSEEWQAFEGDPAAYCFLGATELMAVYPQPAEDGTLRIVAATVPPAIIADDDEPVIPLEHHASLVDYAVVRVRAMEGGNELLGELWRMDRFLGAVASHSNYTGVRARQRRYDVQPFEMRRFDRAAFLADIVRRAKAA